MAMTKYEMFRGSHTFGHVVYVNTSLFICANLPNTSTAQTELINTGFYKLQYVQGGGIFLPTGRWCFSVVCRMLHRLCLHEYLGLYFCYITGVS